MGNGVATEPQAATDLEPVHVGHEHVEHDGVGGFEGLGLECFLAVGRGRDRVALVPQRAGHGVAHRLFVSSTTRTFTVTIIGR